MAKDSESKLMTQYAEMKRRHPDAVLLFRVGDFYETFGSDAVEASSILGITLTKRGTGYAKSTELAGFPHHALETYLPRLVRAGKRVAICEQLEDPKLTKKLVKRGITELVTPGVNMSESAMSVTENTFLAGVHFGRQRVGIAFLDISTGEFLCAEGDEAYMEKLLGNMAPKEILVERGKRDRLAALTKLRSPRFELEEWIFTTEAARERLLRHFSTKSLKGFGVEQMPEAIIAAGSLLYYLDQTQHLSISHITALSRIDEARYVRLDSFTTRNLELMESMAPDGKSLFSVIRFTRTPMGDRLLRRWLLFPIVDIEKIKRRHNVVEYLLTHTELHDALEDLFKRVGDLEKILSRCATKRIGPRDMLALGTALHTAAKIKSLLAASGYEALENIAGSIEDTTALADTIESVINPDAPALASKGNIIGQGVDKELDELRALSNGGKDALQNICQREIEATGITSLKIGFNNVFGYYIEVRNTYRDKVPPTWIRKQTLVAAERYITPELKDYETRIMSAEADIAAIEARIFTNLVEEAARYVVAIRQTAAAIARADVLNGFATAAKTYSYCRPEINDSLEISITDGRHPVIERCLPPGEPYIANSLRLNSDDQQIMMITGPNMSGKSALLRQTALITLMAQAGSFVPAKAAQIGIVDKIFTRVGASDNLSLGESTFMVEMSESASILNNMSARSLILFDELGRGTSTYDGISIAWAIVEHIHQNGRIRPRTLFATHYHELNEMENTYPRIANFNVAVEEKDGKTVFIRKLRRGGSEHSFGIHVAAAAGIPRSIVKRAEQVLKELENAGANVEGTEKQITKTAVKEIGKTREGYQMSFFQLDDPLLSQIRDSLLNLNIDNLTPLEALNTLHSLQSLLKGK